MDFPKHMKSTLKSGGGGAKSNFDFPHLHRFGVSGTLHCSLANFFPTTVWKLVCFYIFNGIFIGSLVIQLVGSAVRYDTTGTRRDTARRDSDTTRRVNGFVNEVFSMRVTHAFRRGNFQSPRGSLGRKSKKERVSEAHHH